MSTQISVHVSRLDAAIPQGIPVRWQGREFPSGPLEATLDSAAGPSGGVLDYSRRRAEVTFHVKLQFPEFAGMLAGLGVDPALAAPVRAVIHSAGDILDDHSFALDGPCDLLPHALFNDPAQPSQERSTARMLPGA